jgi:hypothetical protein
MGILLDRIYRMNRIGEIASWRTQRTAENFEKSFGWS